MAKSQTNVTADTKKNKASDSNGTSKSSKNSEKKNKKPLSIFLKKNLKDIYSAEKQLIEALPKIAKAAYDEDLQDAFTEHLEQTKRHAERLEKIFERLRIENKDEKCEAMEGLINEGNRIIEEFEQSPIRDSALIIGAQKIEHYEIAAYGSLCELADVLGYSQIAEMLERTLEEEEATDQELTCIAINVNDEAYEMNQEEEQMENA